MRAITRGPQCPNYLLWLPFRFFSIPRLGGIDPLHVLNPSFHPRDAQNMGMRRFRKRSCLGGYKNGVRLNHLHVDDGSYLCRKCHRICCT
ncbi:hypothetical protein AVEN_181684-1 [Araneus ventricosus]|uniref:Uncharacterized protein n=1 Tax=Araneus ventricosus TaxID=182803 RepID=A0A4Y2NV13_ARAVE|nr:hypothetical protein AVEN_181684-1 [Araneus ventricosus]